MGYVMLSRIQTLSQLYIIDSVPENKLRPWPSALEELEKMNSKALNKDDIHVGEFKLTSLNSRSFRKHVLDVKGDYQLLKSHVICLQETWLDMFEESDERYKLNSIKSHFNSQGRGIGIVTFYVDSFVPVNDISNPQFQMTKIESPNLSVINVYRSNNADNSFLKALQTLISFERTLIICGDFNFCMKEQEFHPIHEYLTGLNFVQLVDEATHIEGRTLDHVYLFLKKTNDPSNFECKVEGCYYSDHDKVIVSLNY